MIPNDNSAIDVLFTLSCLGVAVGILAAAQWAVELHRAGMRRLALHRARQRCVDLSSYREHIRSVRRTP